MAERVFVGMFFLGYGLLAMLRPDLIAKFQKWTQKTILGAKFEAGERTLKIYRVMGLLFVGMAILIVFGVWE